MTTNRKYTTARIAGFVTLLGVLAFIGWGLWLAYHPVPVPLQGQVEARTINVAPKISARIATLAVREGQAVAAGEALVTLDSPEVRARLAQAGAAQAAADAKRDLVDVGARPEEILAARAMWNKATAGVELADKTYRRLNALYKEGLVSQQRNDEAQANFTAALETARAARAQYDTALSGARPQEKQAAGAAARQAAGGVAEVDAAALELVLKSPLTAEVDKIVLHPGELASAGFPILTLVDLTDIWVVFNLREDDFAGIRIGAPLDGAVRALGNAPVRLRDRHHQPARRLRHVARHAPVERLRRAHLRGSCPTAGARRWLAAGHVGAGRAALTMATTGLRAVIARELRHLGRQPWDLALLAWLPAASLALLLWMFSTGVPTGLPIAVVDQDHSSGSRELIRRMASMRGLAVTVQPSSLEAAFAQAATRLSVSGDCSIPACYEATSRACCARRCTCCVIVPFSALGRECDRTGCPRASKLHAGAGDLSRCAAAAVAGWRGWATAGAYCSGWWRSRC